MKIKQSSRDKAGKAAKPSKHLSAEALFEQAQLALQFDEIDEAVDLMRKAVVLEPDNVEVSRHKHGLIIF